MGSRLRSSSRQAGPRGPGAKRSACFSPRLPPGLPALLLQSAGRQASLPSEKARDISHSQQAAWSCLPPHRSLGLGYIRVFDHRLVQTHTDTHTQPLKHSHLHTHTHINTCRSQLHIHGIPLGKSFECVYITGV